jgi:peptidoglycan/xylan/chitin deacetylase (PgdA/CDA1 family)
MELSMSIVFTCSIDDGDPSDLRMADLLSKHGLNATFFVPIKNREGFPVMSAPQMRELGGRFEIGSHTRDHCFLKNIPITEAHYQITEGKKQLEDILGRQVTGFCYPGGKYRQCDAEMVRACGFRYARTIKNLCFDAGDQPYEMPTTLQLYPHEKSVYLRNFIRFGNWLERREALQLVLRHKHWSERLYALFDYADWCGRTFHLWGHTRDIDQFDGWHELDRFLGHVASKVAIENRLTNEQVAARYF